MVAVVVVAVVVWWCGDDDGDDECEDDDDHDCDDIYQEHVPIGAIRNDNQQYSGIASCEQYISKLQVAAANAARSIHFVLSQQPCSPLQRCLSTILLRKT